MRYEATSTEAALAANGKIINAATPWHIIVDTDEETITVRKRNLTMIGVDEEVLSSALFAAYASTSTSSVPTSKSRPSAAP